MKITILDSVVQGYCTSIIHLHYENSRISIPFIFPPGHSQRLKNLIEGQLEEFSITEKFWNGKTNTITIKRYKTEKLVINIYSMMGYDIDLYDRDAQDFLDYFKEQMI